MRAPSGSGGIVVKPFGTEATAVERDIATSQHARQCQSRTVTDISSQLLCNVPTDSHRGHTCTVDVQSSDNGNYTGVEPSASINTVEEPCNVENWRSEPLHGSESESVRVNSSDNHLRQIPVATFIMHTL